MDVSKNYAFSSSPIGMKNEEDSLVTRQIASLLPSYLADFGYCYAVDVFKFVIVFDQTISFGKPDE